MTNDVIGGENKYKVKRKKVKGKSMKKAIGELSRGEATGDKTTSAKERFDL
jgi:hypothetical protein